LAGFIILVQQVQLSFYKSDDYIVSVLNSSPSPTVQPTYTPQPTYTLQPISIILVTPIIEMTSTNTIAIPTQQPVLLPTATATLIIEPMAQSEIELDAPNINEIEAPEYNFGNDFSVSATTLQQEPSLGINAVEFDLAYLYQFIIALLEQLGIIELVSANAQLIIIVGIAMLLLALFVR